MVKYNSIEYIQNIKDELIEEGNMNDSNSEQNFVNQSEGRISLNLNWLTLKDILNDCILKNDVIQQFINIQKIVINIQYGDSVSENTEIFSDI
jgi:hypothetical protein